MSPVLHLPPEVKQVLLDSMLLIKLVLLIEWQSLQPLPHLDRHGELLDVGRLEIKKVEANENGPISYLIYDSTIR